MIVSVYTAEVPRQPKIELASVEEAKHRTLPNPKLSFSKAHCLQAAEKVSRTSEAVNDLTRQASFESPVLGFRGFWGASHWGLQWFLLPGFGGLAWFPATGFHT